MEETERFAARLRELRQQNGMTQGQLAESVNVTIRSISRLETAAQEPTWPIAVRLARALGVDCSAFQQEPASATEEKTERGRPAKRDEAPETPKPAKKKGKKK